MEEFTQHLANAVDGLEVAQLQPRAELDAFPVWDSLAVLCVIAMADEAYGRTVNGPQVNACSTVAELYTCVTGKDAA